MKAGLFSCVKDEGPFILEWIAYHQLIGFDRFLIYSNDSTDGTTELLDSMMNAGHIVHVIQDLNKDDKPQHVAADKAYGHPEFNGVDWLMWLDTDEFLYCNTPSNRLKELVENVDADGICVNWLIFGDSGHEAWQPGLITSRFTRRGEDSFSRNVMFKTLFRKSHYIRGFGIHRPFLQPSVRQLGGFFVNAAHQRMHDDFYRSGRFNRHAMGDAPRDLISHDAAAICHYAVKTRDSFELKRRRGQGTKPIGDSNRSSRFRDQYWTIYNQNTIKDHRMMRFAEQIKNRIAFYLSDPRVYEAHSETQRRYADSIAQNLRSTSD